jgi:glucose-6-phosphate dehydrogenase assembly protein OpcA
VSDALLDSATPVAFGEIESALTRETTKKKGTGAPARALTATVVAVGPAERLEDAVEPLQALGASGAIRGILIPEGSASSDARVASNVVVLPGLKDNFIDNAVAALRLSSLPTVIWWRGGPTSVLDNLIKLADRVVLDADPPDEGWRCAVDRFERTAFSDLRWTRLTRWRALMAQFFDMPEVRDSAAAFDHLCIEANDRPSAQLFAAWMRSALQWRDNVTIEIQEAPRPAPIACISLTGGSQDLHLRLAKSHTCVESAMSASARNATSRVVSLGDETLASLLTEELRIRSRDRAFEHALRLVVA